MNNYIYALQSPIDNKIYYVGKSKGSDGQILRPYDHYNSHNIKISEWYKSVGEPFVIIIERNCKDLDARECYWINKYYSDGQPLFNINIPKRQIFKYDNYSIRDFIKQKRKKHSLTQVEFSKKSGVGLRFARELEQGKESCRIDKVLQALKLFNATLIAIEIKDIKENT